MAVKVSKVDLWMAAIEDRAGRRRRQAGAAFQGGANFEFVFTRRTPEAPGKGLMVVSPIKGTKAVQAATAAGFTKSLQGVRIEGTGQARRHRNGLPHARRTRESASARSRPARMGASSSATSRSIVPADAAKAAAVLRKLD
jgi:hypothetical protein